MAKEVDLSSKRWLDLVFEGKNKDFGAYDIRIDSDKRHNKSILFTTIIALLLTAGLFLYAWKERRDREEYERIKQERLEQEQLKQAEIEMPEVEDEDIYLKEEEIIEVQEEEVQQSQQVTEMKIVEDELVKTPPKTADEIKENDKAIGAVDEDKGTDDPTKATRQIEETVVKELPKQEEKKEEPKPEPKPKEEEVFKSAAHMPSFPGGDAALMQFINKNIKYPQVAQDNGVQGKVIVQFVVEKDGKVGEVKVARGVDKDLDREAVRVCKMLPKFSPGRNAVGDPVRVWYTLPVTFKLQGVN